MRRFRQKFVLALFVPAVMHGEDSLSVTVNPHWAEVGERIEAGIEAWRLRTVTEGRLNAILHLESIAQSDSGGIRLLWANNHGRPVAVDSVILAGKSAYSPAVTERITKPFRNKTASGKTVDEVRSELSSYTFIKLEKTPYYARFQQDRIALVIPVRSSVDNRFSGIVGYLPSPQGRGRLTGDVSLSFSNLFGYGASSKIRWARKDERSQRFSLKESVPFIPGTSLGAGFGVSQSLQDGLYLRRRGEFELTSLSKKYGTLSVGTSETVTSPTESGREVGVRRYRSRAVTLGQSFRRGKGTVLRDGIFLESRLELGDLKMSDGKNGLLAVGRFHGGWTKTISPPWSAFVSFRAGRAMVSDQQVPAGEKFRFGGASSLRGFGEEQFAADWMVIHQSELRYDLGENIVFYGFVDGALTSVARQPLALGIGFKQPTAIGMLSVEYAVSRDDRPSQGKIHLRISGRIG